MQAAVALRRSLGLAEPSGLVTTEVNALRGHIRSNYLTPVCVLPSENALAAKILLTAGIN